ncbi:hypothetical protein DW799_10335 [Blautia obeum]|nr:hypothetical protein DW799_10335 [Blautia obeum]
MMWMTGQTGMRLRPEVRRRTGHRAVGTVKAGILMEKQGIQDGKNRLNGKLKAGRKSRPGRRTGQMRQIQK